MGVSELLRVFAYGLCLVAPAVGLAVAIRRRYFSPISDIPGPFWASFWIGWQVWHVIRGDIELEMIKLHEKYGYFVRISHKEVCVSHPDAIRKILLTPLRKGDWYKVMSLPDHRFQTPMSEVDPKRRVQRAKNVAAGYALSNIIKSEAYISQAIELLEKRWDALSDKDEQVELDRWFNYMAFDIIGEVTFSTPFGFLETGTDIGGAIANSRALTLVVAVMGFFPWIHRKTLGNPAISDYKLAPTQHIFDTGRRAVNNRMNNPEARSDMMDQWLQQRKEHPESFTDYELQGVANATIGAGADTVSATLQAFYYYLMRSPQNLRRLRAEIDVASAEGKLSKVVTYVEAQALPFLQACIKETFRMHPAVAFSLPRVVPEEGLEIGGHSFPSGVLVGVNPWVMHRSTEYFGPDANEYNPQRWLEPRAKDMEKYMMQFGAGYNSCPGRNLANLEISKTTATLTRDFEITQVNPGQPWKYESHFTAVPYGWPCKVKRRATAGNKQEAPLTSG